MFNVVKLLIELLMKKSDIVNTTNNYSLSFIRLFLFSFLSTSTSLLKHFIPFPCFPTFHITSIYSFILFSLFFLTTPLPFANSQLTSNKLLKEHNWPRNTSTTISTTSSINVISTVVMLFIFSNPSNHSPLISNK